MQDTPYKQQFAKSATAEEVLDFWNKFTIDKVQGTKALEKKLWNKLVGNTHKISVDLALVLPTYTFCSNMLLELSRVGKIN